MAAVAFMGIGIMLEKLKEWLTEEFKDFGRPVSEQKLIEHRSEPPSQVAEVKAEAAQQSQAQPPTPAQEASAVAERITPKMATKFKGAQAL